MVKLIKGNVFVCNKCNCDLEPDTDKFVIESRWRDYLRVLCFNCAKIKDNDPRIAHLKKEKDIIIDEKPKTVEGVPDTVVEGHSKKGVDAKDGKENKTKK